MKLMYFYENRHYEFYDLNNDIGEANNLANGNMTVQQYKLAARAARELRAWLDDTGASYPTVRADGSPVPAPSYLPAVSFSLDESLDGLANEQIDKLGITISLWAAGENATFHADAVGVGVNSSFDTGGMNQQGRIDGTHATPEAIELSFDKDVVLRSLAVEALNTTGNESVVLSFVSGDNPFEDLTGYDSNGFTTMPEALIFDGSNANAMQAILEFGVLGQDEIFLTAGTVLSISADPAAGGGILLSGISVAQPLEAVEQILLDYNLDGQIDEVDLAVWQSTNGSRSDLRADGNADGAVSGADFLLWQQTISVNASTANAATAVPEPAGLALLVAASLIIAMPRSR